MNDGIQKIAKFWADFLVTSKKTFSRALVVFYLASQFLRSNFDDKLPRLFGAHGQCVHPCAQRFNTTRLRFFAISQPFFHVTFLNSQNLIKSLKKSVWLFSATLHSFSRWSRAVLVLATKTVPNRELSALVTYPYVC